MPENPNPPDLFNPVTLWTDLGLRALEMTLSSSQDMSDNIDRLTRAGASPQTTELVQAGGRTGRGDGSADAAGTGLALAAQLQRSTFELLTTAWRQWMNTLGTLASFGSGRGFADGMARQNPWLNPMGMQWGSAIGQAGGSASAKQGAHRRSAEARVDTIEHGLATDEPKRRTRARRAKPKTRSRR
jgi:hypothetical protein